VHRKIQGIVDNLATGAARLDPPRPTEFARFRKEWPTVAALLNIPDDTPADLPAALGVVLYERVHERVQFAVEWWRQAALRHLERAGDSPGAEFETEIDLPPDDQLRWPAPQFGPGAPGERPRRFVRATTIAGVATAMRIAEDWRRPADDAPRPWTVHHPVEPRPAARANPFGGEPFGARR